MAEQPDSVEARRALRAALREQKRRQEAAPPGPDGYPELDATFQAALTKRDPGAAGDQATQVSAPTELAPTVLAPAPPSSTAPAAPAPDRRWLLVGGAFLVLAACRRGRAAAPAAPAAAAPRAAAASELRIPVRSQPPGAAVWLDGRDTGVVTNGELVLKPPLPARLTLTLKRAGRPDATRTLQLPLAAGAAAEFDLGDALRRLPVRTQPPGATVTLDGAAVAGATPLELALDPALEHKLALALDGYTSQEIRVKPGSSPAALDVTLEKQAPPGGVAVESAYPLDVVWRGRTLAKAESSPRVQLTSGRQQLTLVASDVFLKADFTVEVPPGGEATLAAPTLGRLNVRATPDNCQVFVDDVFVDYPPIRERPLAAGHHTVSFKWPDGKSSQQAVEVQEGKPSFVEGRKE